ncbi:hypothetical protein TTHERM_00694380 (macronuclear) [Tetrahymena thermophila SB210]|uniref:Uncharacterized protein n=1 Tax=Tetrahymena thermophila (strain SB210) TaxID=312017 RepID=Q244X9_TETTS|nr:hypothetical protein TTHERM_00694380 [Tetrahymena thermophila SB210]EAS03358.2 hypothetical protein TTHERM_00694380 [Tetrahymena thermophila SB210]|eukprot:XP_001023603.2 hypothetical protein TTHERM_00694380 [Tetrahymena thermophila SB210]
MNLKNDLEDFKVKELISKVSSQQLNQVINVLLLPPPNLTSFVSMLLKDFSNDQEVLNLMSFAVRKCPAFSKDVNYEEEYKRLKIKNEQLVKQCYQLVLSKDQLQQRVQQLEQTVRLKYCEALYYELQEQINSNQINDMLQLVQAINYIQSIANNQQNIQKESQNEFQNEQNNKQFQNNVDNNVNIQKIISTGSFATPIKKPQIQNSSFKQSIQSMACNMSDQTQQNSGSLNQQINLFNHETVNIQQQKYQLESKDIYQASFNFDSKQENLKNLNSQSFNSQQHEKINEVDNEYQSQANILQEQDNNNKQLFDLFSQLTHNKQFIENLIQSVQASSLNKDN